MSLPFCPPRRAPHSPALRRAQPPAEVQRKTPRPSGSNPPAAVRVPRSADAEKELPVRGEPACGSSCAPVSRCRKGAARIGRTRLRQFACPGQPVQQKEPPVRDEPACGSSRAPLSRCSKRSRPSGSNPPAAVRVPRSAGAEKEPPVRVEPACGSSCAPVSRCSKRSRPDRANPPAAVRVPWSPCAEKRKAPQNCFHGAQSMHFYSNRSSVSTSLRAGACGSCAG